MEESSLTERLIDTEAIMEDLFVELVDGADVAVIEAIVAMGKDVWELKSIDLIDTIMDAVGVVQNIVIARAMMVDTAAEAMVSQ